MASGNRRGWYLDHDKGILAAVLNTALPGTTALVTNTARESIFDGTPVTPALAVDSIVISNNVAGGDILIAANNSGNSQAWLWVDASAGTMALYGAGTAIAVLSSSAFEIEDDKLLALGNDQDQVLLNRASTLAAGTALTGVLVGTPVKPALAANSLVISNTTASGDILLAANLGGNSQAWLWVDSSASLLTLYAAGVEAVTFGAGVTTFNLGQADRDFKIRGSSFDSMFFVDAAVPAISMGGGVANGSLLNIAGDRANRAYATSVGMIVNLPATTLTSTNANPTTLAIGPVVAIGTQTYAGANAGQTVSDAVTLYIANPPQQGSNMTLTRAWALWVDSGNTRFDGNVDMSYAASDIVMGAATAVALEISDGTTKFYAFDTRVAVVGVTTHALDISDYTLASAAAAVATGLSLAAHTLNLTGNTQVTTQCDTVVIGARTIAADGNPGACTVDEANTLLLVAPTEGANTVVTASAALRIIDGGGTPVNQYGIFIETLTAGATADYAIWVAGANAVHLGTAGTAAGTLEIDGSTSGTLTIIAGASTTSHTMTMPPTANTNAGYQLTCAGADTITSWAGPASSRELKDIKGEHDATDALNKMLGVKVYDFHYKQGKGTLDNKTTYVGVMADEAPWAMHHEGGLVNPVNSLGYTVLAFQAMAAKVKALESKLAALGV